MLPSGWSMKDCLSLDIEQVPVEEEKNKIN